VDSRLEPLTVVMVFHFCSLLLISDLTERLAFILSPALTLESRIANVGP
jgi:hypothetical protein